MKSLLLNMLRAFALVYKTGGIRSAARELEVSHSAVSRYVGELEKHLGVVLMERGSGSQPVRFTAYGQRLGRAAYESLRSLERAVTTVRQGSGSTQVVLETTPSFAARWLSPRLSRFREDVGWVELSVAVDQDLASHLDAPADLLVRLGRGPWPGFETLAVLDDSLVPVTSPSYWKTLDTDTPMQDARLLHDQDILASWSVWFDAFENVRADVADGPRYASGDLVLNAAEQGLGVALARASMAGPSLRDGRVVTLFSGDEVPLPASIWILAPVGSKRRKAVTATLDWLLDQAENDDSLSISSSWGNG